MTEPKTNQERGENPDSENQTQREEELLERLESQFEAGEEDLDTVEESSSVADEVELADTEETVRIAEMETQMAELEDQLARARAEIYNLNQQYSAYVRRSKAEAQVAKRGGEKAVLNLLTAVLDDIYAAEQAGELAGPFAAIAHKLEHILGTNFQLERFGQAGQIFDPNMHEALLANESTEVAEPTIAQILQPGYRLGEEVLRAAKVVVDNPA